MSKKSNPISLQLIKNKQWFSKSFFENYNYSKVLYQDLYIQNYIKFFFKYNMDESLIHNISIQRKGLKVLVFIDYYKNHSVPKKIFGNTGEIRKKAVRIKTRLRWSNNKKIYKLIGQNKSSSGKKYLRGYVNRQLGFLPNKYEKRLFISVKKNKTTFFSIFSLKRLLVLNLIFLTGCLVQVRVRNIAGLFKLPFIMRKSKQPVAQAYYKKYIVSIKDIMYKFRILNNRRLFDFNVASFIHLFFTSLIFKNPELVGIFLSKVLKRNIKTFYIFFNTLSRILSSLFVLSSLNGLKIQFKGRLGMSLRKRTLSIVLGTMPLQTLDSLIKYSFSESMTVYGICSIKVWYYY